jgi:tRNA(Ile2) C34 agmatinyltransferase TiaS
MNEVDWDNTKCVDCGARAVCKSSWDKNFRCWQCHLKFLENNKEKYDP